MRLKENEELVMDILWEANKPITSTEIARRIAQRPAKKKSDINVHRILKTLLDNKLISVCGFEPSGKVYARQLAPVLSQEEYIVKTVKGKNLKADLLAKIALGFAREAEKRRSTDEIGSEVVLSLQEVIDQLKETKEA